MGLRGRAMENPQEFYKKTNAMSAPGARAADFSALPRDIAGLCRVIQGVLIHVDIGPFAYGVKFSEERQRDRHVRPVVEMLKRIRELVPEPLAVEREPQQR